MSKPLRFMWPKEILKEAETIFWTSSTWYYFCKPDLILILFIEEDKKPYPLKWVHEITRPL